MGPGTSPREPRARSGANPGVNPSQETNTHTLPGIWKFSLAYTSRLQGRTLKTHQAWEEHPNSVVLYCNKQWYNTFQCLKKTKKKKQKN